MLYTLTHKDIQNNNSYKVLYLGADIMSNQDFLYDCEGDNISNKNSTYCELTGIYWLWKNCKDNIIGINHYGRYFLYNGLLTQKDAEEILNKYDIIVSIKAHFPHNVGTQYCTYHLKEDLDILKETVKTMHPECIDAMSSVINRNYLYPFNMFVAKKDIYDEYCAWLFPILFKIESIIKPENREDTYQKRVIGFLAERLFNIWLEYKKLNMKELEIMLPEKSRECEEELLVEMKEASYLWHHLANKKVLLIDNINTNIENKYDLIVINGCFEISDKVQMLNKAKVHLNENGRILLYTDNKYALKYFAGEKDILTGNFADSLENYVFSNTKNKLLSLSEIKEILKECSIDNYNVYSVFPNIEHPKFIIKENYKPIEKMSNRYFSEYIDSKNIFLNEEYIIDGLFDNNFMPNMANGLLFEISLDSNIEQINEVVLSADRGKYNSFATILKDNEVIKKNLYLEGSERLLKSIDYNRHLTDRGINIVEGKLVNGEYVMPYLNYELANKYFQRLIKSDIDKFYVKFDEFVNLILKSDEMVDDNNGNLVLRHAFLDMVPLNCFVNNDEFIFFDQEYMEEYYPANPIIARSIHIIYELDNEIESILPKNQLLAKYDLLGNINLWNKMSIEFTYKLRNEDILKKYNNIHQKNIINIFNNRNRMNYSEEEYRKLFYNPLVECLDKNIYAVGNEDAVNKFIDIYSNEFKINKITNLGELKNIDINNSKVVICDENYKNILININMMGINNVSIYNPNGIYSQIEPNTIKYANKKYHIGYIPGVFDLFHIGHVNLLEKAKELCDYLIVGIVSDEGVRDFKGVEPFIPFEERIKMVESCKYADKVVKIPYQYRETLDAYRKYQFDVIFFGSDYENNPLWLEHKKVLNEFGAEMVFLPYTKETSSSKIKALINNKLL